MLKYKYDDGHIQLKVAERSNTCTLRSRKDYKWSYDMPCGSAEFPQTCFMRAGVVSTKNLEDEHAQLLRAISHGFSRSSLFYVVRTVFVHKPCGRL